MLMRTASAGIFAIVVASTACSQPIDVDIAASSTASSEDDSLSEQEAIDMAMQTLRTPTELELIGDLGVPEAWRMTWGEFQDEFSDGQDSRARELPMWIVQVPGTWRGAGITPPEARTTRNGYGLVAVNASDGTMFAMTIVEEPVR